MELAEYDLMDAVEDGMWWYRALHAQVLDALDSVRPGHGRLLDAGCGTGGSSRGCGRERPDQPAAGLEYNPAAAARAEAKSGVPVAAGTINAMPFADASFSVVVSLDVLSHAAVDPERALAEMLRVLASWRGADRQPAGLRPGCARPTTSGCRTPGGSPGRPPAQCWPGPGWPRFGPITGTACCCR
ncbi:class I SAM-dependent methyltransferase [Dankookia sp. P2]|uniref:class I SAM-dependent methyltransferase n=1 Tax=Dankookia sp. P2 TaxID=3423955 RepID=UPI003D675701